MKKPLKGRTSTKNDQKKVKHATAPSGQGIYGNKPPKKSGSTKGREKRLEGRSL